MRVLHAIYSMNLECGGPQEAIVQVARATKEMGHDTEVVTLDPPDSPWLGDFDFPIHALGPTKSRYLYCPKLEPWLRENSPNFDATVLHTLWFHLSHQLSKVYRDLDLPYFVYTHGSLDPAIRRVFPLKHIRKQIAWTYAERKTLNSATSVLFTCEEERQLAQKTFFPGLNCRNEVILPYCVGSPPAANDRQTEAFAQRFPELKDKRIILFLSRVHPKKAVDLAIEAFASNCGGNDEFRLVIAGPTEKVPAYFKRMEAIIDKCGVRDQVVWAGMLKDDLKWGAFRSSELFILPSHQENFGIAVVEALACGVPVLISNRVNIWREIEEENAGIICQDNKASATEALSKWMQLDVDDRSKMSSQALTCFANRFAIEHTSKLFIKTLETYLQPATS